MTWKFHWWLSLVALILTVIAVVLAVVKNAALVAVLDTAMCSFLLFRLWRITRKGIEGKNDQ